MPEATATSNAAQKSSKGHPMVLVMGVGFAMIALFIITFITQIQTNEAWVSHAGQVSIFNPDWSTLWQIPNLFGGGHIPSGEAAADLVGWAIELVYLALIVGYEVVKEAVHNASGPLMAKIFRTLSWGLVGLNAYTDYQYGTIGSGIIGHIAFSATCSLIVGFFGTIGLFLVEYSWKRA